ncbi:MAG: BamA/TamA family outer membrane protein [Gemmatimonadetes bacterium]|nr:BamA/TamA family outer membrane protein [Gemmatimonadota bacterium]MBT6902926.1 BamA/TamA family outer membrane protein [Gemmatimonadota bacterium]MBT7547188.1 BamA/TamA family outer membrane protein [Gemmatimonadota bacterium]MBT7588469.1 BamA/TamA family outer membrane protein [Gemmatimonadota bacterium]
MSRLTLMLGLLLGAGWGGPAAAQNHPELDWQVVETEHFRILYHQGLEGAAARTAQIAEAAYDPITKLYGYHPDDRVRIVLKDYDDYANGAAFFYHDTIEIWTTALDHDFDLRGTSDWLRNVITHEFTHIISLGTARKGSQRVPALYLQYFGYQREENRPDILIGYPDAIASYPIMSTVVPMWLAEGAAQYMAEGAHQDRWDANRDMVLRAQVLAGEQLPFDQMGIFGKHGFGNEYVYDHGYGLVRYIAETYGEQKIAELYRAASAWRSLEIDGAFDKALGKSVDELYDEWVVSMRAGYEAQVASLGELNEGELVSDLGFSNLRPQLSPDGKKLAYLSTRKRQYGPHMLVVRDLETEEDEVVAFPVAASTVDWSADGQKLLFSRIDRADKYGSRQADIYEYDFTVDEPGFLHDMIWALPAMVAATAPETPRIKQLTHGLRALYPTYSPDGEWIAFVKNKGSNNNLGMMRADGSDLRYLTDFQDGTQVYTPRFSPDGKRLVFSISRQGQRDIAMVDLVGVAVQAGNRVTAAEPKASVVQEGLASEGTEVLAAEKVSLLGSSFKGVIATPGTDRDPVWSADGKQVVFSSDYSGIFNVYALDLGTQTLRQITNVIGGAFNPTVGSTGEIFFASYTAKGFEIRHLSGEGVSINVEGQRSPRWVEQKNAAPAKSGWVLTAPEPLASSAPAPVLQKQAEPYGIDFLKTSLLPRLSMDEGHFKPGVYVSSSDVLNRQNIFAGAAIAPANGDRDLFAMYEYRGFRPTFFLEVFNQSRHSARGDSTDARDLIVNGVNFNLNQISVGGRGRLGRYGRLAASFTYDRYDASVESDAFRPRRDGQVGFERIEQKPFGYTYLNGFGLGLTYRMDLIARRRDREINPLGRQIYFRYDRMFNYFIEGFNESASFIDEQYLNLFYNQVTLDWNEYIGLPWNTRLGMRFYGGWIDSDKVDDKEQVNDFFDYHLGGLNFMKGYTFYSIEGRKAMMGTATLRLPLLPRIGKRFMHLYFDKVYGAVYGDIGKAWDGEISDPDEFYGREGPLRSLGGQLRFDMVSYYSLPTRVQMDWAYGVDEVEERSPWKFYFTVLFGYL